MIKLCMILRDEAHCIARTLQSAGPYVDRYCVLDTGSTDGTPALVRAIMGQHHVPGDVHVEPFTDYASTRNRLIELATCNPDDDEPWLLMLDAEDELQHGQSLRFMLQIAQSVQTCFHLRQVWPDGEVLVPRVVRAGSPWRYVGKVHELLEHPDGQPAPVLLGPHLRHWPTAIGQARSRARWPEDVRMLQAQLADNPGDLRARWHLDRTLQALATSTNDSAPPS